MTRLRQSKVIAGWVAAALLVASLVLAGNTSAQGIPILEVSPSSVLVLPTETSFTFEVFNSGIGGPMLWDFEVVEDANWEADGDAIKTVVMGSEDDPVTGDPTVENWTNFTEGMKSVGSVRLNFFANATFLKRSARLRVFQVDAAMMRVSEIVEVLIVQDEKFAAAHSDYPNFLEENALFPVVNAFYDGHIQKVVVEGGTDAVPTNYDAMDHEDRMFKMVRSSFNQPTAFTRGLVNHVERELFDPTEGALRFRTQLFGSAGTNALDDNSGMTSDPNDTRSAFEQALDQVSQLEFNRDALLVSLFGDAERAALAEAREDIRDLLRFDPFDRFARNLLLDIAYNQSLLFTVRAKEKMVRAYTQRIFPRNPLVPIIDNEIGLFEEAYLLFDQAMDPYFDLFADPVGVDLVAAGIREIGDADADSPFGLFIFQEEVPQRPLFSASFFDRYGELRPVMSNSGQVQATESASVDGFLPSDAITGQQVTTNRINLQTTSAATINLEVIFEKSPANTDGTQNNRWMVTAQFYEFVGETEVAKAPEVLTDIEFRANGELPLADHVRMIGAVPGDFNSQIPLDLSEIILVQETESLTLTTSDIEAPGPQMLIPGYKDYELIFEIYEKQFRTTVEISRLAGLKGGQVDLDFARAAIRRVLDVKSPEFDGVRQLIPNWRQEVEPSAAIIGTLNGVVTSRNDVENQLGFLNGDNNALGFDKEMLLLIQAFENIGTDIFDTYNQILQWTDPNANFTTPLSSARDKLQEARDSYFNFREQQDELQSEFRTQNLEYRDRLAQITGVDPGPDIDNPVAGFELGRFNAGSELRLQQQSIGIAMETINIGNAETDVLLNEMENELEIINKTEDINTNIADVRTRSAEQRGGLKIGISVVEGVSKTLDGFNSAISFESDSPDAFIIRRVILGVSAFQGALEVVKGGLEYALETNAAAEQNEIDVQLTGLDTFMRLQNLENLNEQLTVGNLQGFQQQSILGQEEGRLKALELEQQLLMQRMRENNEALTGRFFADPIHRIMQQADAIEAQQAFESAQRWMFFAVRALEYKWNTPFIFSDAGRNYTSNSVFSVRNAEELEEFVLAMQNFDGLLEASHRGDDRYDKLSLKEDLMDFPTQNEDGSDIAYADPTDPTATVNADTRFSDELALNWRVLNSATGEGVITLRFSTAKDMGGTFFRGPRYDESGTVLDKGMFVDKIDWIKVNLVGDPMADDSSLPDSIESSLVYGGTGIIRNISVGDLQFIGPDIDNRVLAAHNEVTGYPARFWVWDPGDPFAEPPVGAAWSVRTFNRFTRNDPTPGDASSNDFVSLNGQVAPITLAIREDADLPESVAEINVFKEYSVATTEWTLVMFLPSAAVKDDFITWLDDIELHFYHRAKDRP